jgi:hypothetical protein
MTANDRQCPRCAAHAAALMPGGGWSCAACGARGPVFTFGQWVGLGYFGTYTTVRMPEAEPELSPKMRVFLEGL